MFPKRLSEIALIFADSTELELRKAALAYLMDRPTEDGRTEALLTKLLRDPNPELRIAAIRALRPQLSAQVKKELLQMVEKGDESTTADAIRALTRSPELSFLPLIAKQLNNSDEDAKVAAIDFLGVIGPPAVGYTQRLQEFTRNPREVVVNASRLSLALVGRSATALVDDAQQLSSILDLLRAQNEEPWMEAQMVPLLESRVAKSTNLAWPTYYSALASFKQSSPVLKSSLLSGMFSDTESYRQFAMNRILKDKQELIRRVPWRRFLRDDMSDAICLGAAKTLWLSEHDSAALPIVIAKLTESQRYRDRSDLGRNSPGLDRVLECINSYGVEARQAIPILVVILDKQNKSQARVQAMRTLGNFGAVAISAVPRLETIKEEEAQDAELCCNASAALWRIRKSKSDFDYLISQVTKFRSSQDVLNALATLGPDAKEAIPAIAELREHRDPSIRSMALEAIKRIQSPNQTESGFSFLPDD